jgi:hypothetical protein
MSLKALKMADGRYDAALNFLLKQGELGKLSPGEFVTTYLLNVSRVIKQTPSY